MDAGRRRFIKGAIACATSVVSCRSRFENSGLADLPAGVLWRADHETADLSQWYYPSIGPVGNYGGGAFASGMASFMVSSEKAHRGTYAAKCTIATPDSVESGVRLFRWAEPRAYRSLYFSAWFFFPVVYRLADHDAEGRFWNLFQFKSRSTDGRNDPLWAFYAKNDGGSLKIAAGWGWGGTTAAGPFANDDVGGKFFSQTAISIPVGDWTHFEAFLKQSNTFDGTLIFWQDGMELFNFQNIRTSYVHSDFNSWNCSNEWSVNNYSDGLIPDPATIYIDDATISVVRKTGANSPKLAQLRHSE